MSREGGGEAFFQRDLSAPIEERRFEVGAPDHGQRLDLFLAERMAWRSRARIQNLITDGRVTVEPGKDRGPGASGRLRAGTRLRVGNDVIVRLDSAFVDAAVADTRDALAAGADGDGGAAGDGGVAAEDATGIAIEVVYEDEHLVAVSKPPRMNLYPTRRHLGGSLTELVHRRHGALGLGGAPPSPCHRLDRETSGVVLFAKDRATRADIGRQFEARTIEKTYLAMVAGSPTADEGVIELPLGRDLASRVEIKQGPRFDGGGLEARTRWRLLARFEASVCEGFEPDRGPRAPSPLAAGRALLELRPETGRQHQLRAHLAAIGHPILGDKLYLGGDDLFLASLDRELHPGELAALGGSDRLALHAWSLLLRHPDSGNELAIEAPSPAEWSSWRIDASGCQ
jgi:23S rRNA-/tRNA-specific pseudouridylate synthase